MTVVHTFQEQNTDKRWEKQTILHRRCLLLLRDLRDRQKEVA